MERQYIAIDLKSYYASVEVHERGLDPLTTNLVVADESRTDKTICLAVSPALKSFGVPGRPRLFEVIEKVRQVNAQRQRSAPNGQFAGSSYDLNLLNERPDLAITYLVAPPRMAYYIEYSTRIYQIYLRYIAPEDIHVYSIDEVFIDATPYLHTYNMTAHTLAMRIIRDVLDETGITATVGIGTNLYLCKVAMDIVAKKMPADADGVRIAELDEMSYRKLLWEHRPITAFWRVGGGTAAKLAQNGIYTMGDVARMSLTPYGEDMLYKLFGVNAELLIDHAWGYEPCTIAEIKRYKPSSNSLCSGQVLTCPYTFAKARIVLKEMADALALDLVAKKLVTDQVVLNVSYDTENLRDEKLRARCKGMIVKDHYGRPMPKPVHGSCNLTRACSSTKNIEQAVLSVFDSIVDTELLIRRLDITVAHLVPEGSVCAFPKQEQLDLFTDPQASQRERESEQQALQKERARQQAVLEIRKRFGKNAILRGMSFEEGATAKERNEQIGGHRA